MAFPKTYEHSELSNIFKETVKVIRELSSDAPIIKTTHFDEFLETNLDKTLHLNASLRMEFNLQAKRVIYHLDVQSPTIARERLTLQNGELSRTTVVNYRSVYCEQLKKVSISRLAELARYLLVEENQLNQFNEHLLLHMNKYDLLKQPLHTSYFQENKVSDLQMSELDRMMVDFLTNSMLPADVLTDFSYQRGNFEKRRAMQLRVPSPQVYRANRIYFTNDSNELVNYQYLGSDSYNEYGMNDRYVGFEKQTSFKITTLEELSDTFSQQMKATLVECLDSFLHHYACEPMPYARRN